jgi:cell division protease FtsH
VRRSELRPVWLSKDTRPVSEVPPVVTQAEREEARRLHAEDPSNLAPQDQAAAARPEHPLEVPERGHSDPEGSGAAERSRGERGAGSATD